jgi:hypothetical protein
MTRLAARSAVPFLCAALALFVLATGPEIVGAATELPVKPRGSVDLWRTTIKAVVAALVLLGLAAAALYAWRHRMRLPGTGSVRAGPGVSLEWARRVSPRTTLLLVRWQRREYLLAESGSATHVIDSRVLEETGV